MKFYKPKFWDKNHLTIQSIILYPFTLIIKISEITNIENCCGLYPTIGENLDFLNSNNLGIHFLYRNIDQNAWKYCNKGFFNFKKYIPKIIEHIL